MDFDDLRADFEDFRADFEDFRADFEDFRADLRDVERPAFEERPPLRERDMDSSLPESESIEVMRRAGVVAGMVKGLGAGAAGIGSFDNGESSIQPPLVHPVSISSSPGIGAPLLTARHDPPPGQAPKRRCERVVPV